MFVNILVNEKSAKYKLYNADEISDILYNGKKSVTVRTKTITGGRKKHTVSYSYSTEEVARAVYDCIVKQLTKEQ